MGPLRCPCSCPRASEEGSLPLEWTEEAEGMSVTVIEDEDEEEEDGTRLRFGWKRVAGLARYALGC